MGGGGGGGGGGGDISFSKCNYCIDIKSRVSNNPQPNYNLSVGTENVKLLPYTMHCSLIVPPIIENKSFG